MYSAQDGLGFIFNNYVKFSHEVVPNKIFKYTIPRGKRKDYEFRTINGKIRYSTKEEINESLKNENEKWR